MMIIELSTYCSDVDVQMQAIKAMKAIASEYTTPIDIMGTWNNYIRIRSNLLTPELGTMFLKSLTECLSTDGDAVHYYISEIIMNRETK